MAWIVVLNTDRISNSPVGGLVCNDQAARIDAAPLSQVRCLPSDGIFRIEQIQIRGVRFLRGAWSTSIFLACVTGHVAQLFCGVTII